MELTQWFKKCECSTRLGGSDEGTPGSGEHSTGLQPSPKTTRPIGIGQALDEGPA